jgi:hypothetical protein
VNFYRKRQASFISSIPQQIADQFNATEEVWRSLAAKRLGRRELCPDLSPDLQIQFDLLDFAMAQSPKDCIGFVVEP